MLESIDMQNPTQIHNHEVEEDQFVGEEVFFYMFCVLHVSLICLVIFKIKKNSCYNAFGSVYRIFIVL